ncbi:MAG TPA: FAD-binding oxidoreductase [Thermoplasmataceae archaeon]|nr:FAD-binding oxidoreductase [Thermoplasmatales archaeon AK]HLH86511.1 FAD-binding oxidoreductase [Thermoplasmataceae archaeon]
METLTQLEKISGKNLITRKEEMLPYGFDASYFSGHTPLAVVVPDTVEEISRVVSFCNENRINVVVRGGGTSLTGASIPDGNTVVISMSKFNRILEVRIEDRYAVVEPGVRLDDLNRHLEAHNHFYPPDPASSVAATVGGSISTNAGGLRASMYGSTKNWILGLQVVLPNGKVVWFGGKVLKRTAGYDLTALMVGAEGTLGVITKAILKIWPKPDSIGRILAYYDRINNIGDAIAALKRNGITPLIAEFLDRITMDALTKAKGLKFPDEADYLLIVDIASSKENLMADLERASGVINSTRPLNLKVTTDPDEMAKIYEARKGAYSSLLSLRSTNTQRVVIGDIVVPASRLPEALEQSEAKLKEHGIKAALFGHIADGNIHANIYADLADQDEMQRVDRFQEDFANIALRLEGSVSAEHGIGLEKKNLLAMEFSSLGSEYNLDLMKMIKKVFDPNNIMNRGKMFD